MRIVLEKTGEIIGQGLLIQAILRYDLIPIPCSVELSVRLTTQTQNISIGDKLALLEDEIPFVIVAEQTQGSDLVQDGQMVAMKSFIAILDGLETLIKPSKKSINLENTSFQQAYKACGLTATRFNADIPLLGFHCFYGKIPSYEVARRCCEEACVILYRDKTLNAIRLDQLNKQTPLYSLAREVVEWENNQSLEQNKIHNYVSISDDGSTVVDNIQGNKQADYYPNADSRILRNLRTVLVRKGCFQRSMNLDLKAGDLIQVGDENYILLTVAHVYATGIMGGEKGFYTKAWLSQIHQGE